jgi:1-acyl-sn-glycerol-3-phosphate acyltransferase
MKRPRHVLPQGMKPVMFVKLFRITAFIALNLLCLPAGVIANLLTVPVGRLMRARAQAVMTMLWSKAACRIFGIRVRLGGSRGKHDGFMVCNHVSYSDIFVLGSLGPTVFLSNHEVRGWPLFGWVAELGGVVFVNRNSKRAALGAISELERKLKAGVTVVVFPEGTTSDGASVGPFRSAFFNIPVRQNIYVRPAGLRYHEKVADYVAWHGGAKLAPHFWRFAGLRRIDAVVTFRPLLRPQSGGISNVEARKRLRTLAHESVVSAFESGGAKGGPWKTGNQQR